jgi:hypothetical protein
MVLKKYFAEALKFVKQKPGSHLSSFLILHEVTAIVPIPVFYYFLDKYDITYSIPSEYTDSGSKRMTKMLAYFGMDVDVNSKQMIHWVASYVIVKAMMPLRIGLCLFLTPFGARGISILTNLTK